MAWLTDLRLHIYKNITPLLIAQSPNINMDSVRKKLVNEEAMRFWIRAFIHQSYNPNDGENSETLEYVGDAFMAAILAEMYTTKYSKISSELLTDLKNSKIWKNEQAKLCDELGLPAFLLTNIAITVSDKEDLLEAVFGALRALGDKIFDIPTGYSLCRNFMINIYKISGDELNVLKIKPAANQLKEIGDKLKWWQGKTGSVNELGNPYPQKDKYHRILSYDLTYILPDKAIRWLQSQGKEIINEGIIAHQTMNNKADTIKAAISEALINLKKYYDIDWNVADNQVKLITEKDIKDIKLEKRMRTDNIIELEFKRYDAKERGGEYYQLIGIKNDGSKTILLTVFKDLKISKINEKKVIVALYKDNGAQNPNTILKLE